MHGRTRSTAATWRRPAILVLVTASIIALLPLARARSLDAQATGHRLFAVGNAFFMEDRATTIVRPFDMWNSRLANALIDRPATARVVAALDDYLRYGVNTICVSIQGGELGPNKNQLYPAAFNLDGSLDLTSPVWANLDRLLDETDRRGMVLNVMIWYHRRHTEVPLDPDALAATRAVATRLRATGHRNYFYDLVNEYDHYAFRLPGQNVKRPLFSSLQGALSLIHAVQTIDPTALVGISPLSALMCPVGILDIPGQPWVEADIIIGHGPIIDPRNTFAYRLGVSPANPLSKPYVNNEFFAQLRYELYVQLDPRTQQLTYGHWDQATITAYLADVQLLRTYAGSPNVFSHYQQYAPPLGTRPTFEIGPAGTQPESTTTPAEGSMHWLFKAIAGIRKFGATPTAFDFNEGHGSGLDERVAGTWVYANGRLEQTDANASPAWARMTADDGDVELAFDARFSTAPGAGWLGVQIGGATPTDPGLRLEVRQGDVRVVEVGSSTQPTTVARFKNFVDRYVLRLAGGRAQVEVSGTRVIDVASAPTGPDQNLLFLTNGAAAAFDNVRLTPLRRTDFEDTTSGPWTPVGPANGWAVVANQATPPDHEWEATIGANESGLAALDRIFGDATFHATIDLGTANDAGVRLRTANAQDTTGDGYTVRINRTGARSGTVTLVRDIAGGSPRPLGQAQVTINPSAVRVGATTEGWRVIITIDGTNVIDVTDQPDAPRLGGYQLVATPGTTRFDDLDIAAGADRWPDAAFTPAPGPPITAGSTLDFTDPDGLNDLRFLSLEVAVGASGYLDVTLLLNPFFGLFRLGTTPDGHGYRFTFAAGLPVGPQPWRLRMTSVDRAGQRSVRVVTVQ